MKRLMAFALAAFVATALLGCATKEGALIQTERVKAIILGESTRSDLFDKFGAPVAVVARDDTDPIVIDRKKSSYYWPYDWPYEWHYTMPYRLNYRLRADTFFTLFPEATDYQKIYYYYYSVFQKYPVILVLYFGEFGDTKTDQLWVLVNEKTGIVEDYAFKRYKEDTVFGRSR